MNRTEKFGKGIGSGAVKYIYDAISSIEKADQGLFFFSLTCEDSHECTRLPRSMLAVTLEGIQNPNHLS